MGLQEAVLGLLTAGPAHGYQLFQTLEGELGPVWETRQSQLYLTLARMERDGLVTDRRISQRALPDRQILALTSKGRARADRWLTTPHPLSDIVVKLAVARIARPEFFTELAASASDQLAGRLRMLRQLSGSLNSGFQLQAVQLEIARRQAEVRWLAAMREDAAVILAQPRAQKPYRGNRSADRLA